MRRVSVLHFRNLSATVLPVFMGRRWRRLKRFLGRPLGEKGLLLESVALLAAARISIAVLPFQRVAPRFGGVPRARSDDSGRRTPDLADRIGWAVGAAARHTPWTSDCLPQALAARRMLARRGLASTLYVGVARSPHEEVVAHAWVRCGETVIVGGEAHDRYTVVATFDHDS